MSSFRKSVKYITAIIIISVFALTAAACNREDDSTRLLLAEAFEKSEAVNDKRISTNANATVVLYDDAGKPMRLTETAKIDRTQNGDTTYLNGSLETTENSLSPMLKLTISVAAIRMGLNDFPDYIKNSKLIRFEAAINGGAINGKADICGLDETPDYIYGFKDETSPSEDPVFLDKNVFFGVSVDDVNKFTADMDRDFLDGLDVAKTVMSPLSLPVDYSAYSNKNSNNKNKKGEYNYSITIPSSALMDFVLESIKDMLDENVEKGFIKEDSIILKIYDEYLETIKGWITVSNATVTAHADGEGRLTSTATGLSVSLSVPDSELTAIAEEIGASIGDMLTMLHTFITAENGVAGLTQAQIILNITENFSYGGELSTDGNDVFSSAEDEIATRTFMKYELNQTTGEYEWKAYGGDFADAFNKKNENQGENPPSANDESAAV